MKKSEKLSDLFNHRTIAIVGNALSLSDQKKGDEIDTYDVVIRLNRAPGQTALTHGSKTTCLVTSVRLSRKFVKTMEVKATIWATPKIYRRPLWCYFDKTSWFFPRKHWKSLYKLLGARPSTGLMCVSLIVNYFRPKKVEIFGFDGFKSGSHSCPTRVETPHDFEKEQLMLLKWQSNKKLKLSLDN